ncbi:hypothetical protein HK105_207980 [Polyrhizophydium stewartii]|uniref:Carrier domain-containing protein n=1 Tax=Polyrhizophydium stewartii TaxID=2732419 RepID=A0ABR4MYY8_9FUNG
MGIALTGADLMSGKSVKQALFDATKRGNTALVWPKVVLDLETIAELAAVGDFVDAYPATPLQAGMVAATMQDARAYANQVPLRATRTVSLESLRSAVRAVVQHHAILRTSFVSTVAGGIVQVVRASADAAECVAVTAPLAQHLAADMARGFSLSDASWIRAALVCDPAGSAQHVVVTIHHALYDGWSLPMIMRDLAAALDGHALEPRPAFRTVVDFIAAQDAAATEAFWTQQLVGLEPAQPLSLGRSARTDDEDAPLAQACSTPMAELQRAAQRAGVTVAVVLKAAWAATLRKFTRSHDVVFGEVLANRDIAVAGADRIVGPLLNTVPCRVVLDDTARAADLVASLQAQHGAVLSHSHAALVDVQRWAGVQGDGKLFNTLFVFEDIDFSVKQDLLEYVGSITNSMNRSTDFDLMLYPGEFDLRFEVLQAPHLSQSQAASILAEFDFGVQQLVSALSDKATIESLWTLSPAQQAMIARFSHGERVPLPFALVHHGFEARAKQHPDWRAVEHGDAHLSYGDLDACGSALAAALASHGVQRGSRVAVVMQRSIEFVVALVGVLKAGATIVPVDSSFPADRIQFMLDDASVCAIVTTASEAGCVAQLSVGDRAVVVADARALLASGVSFTPAAQHMATSDDLFMILYTSGSTGRPKGVPAFHAGAINVIVNYCPSIGHLEKHRVAQFMAIGFDACATEVWGALTHGAILVLRDSDAIATIKTVDSLFITPTGLAHLGSPQDFINLKFVAVAGEACPQELANLWCPHCVFHNIYGPTEITLFSTIARIRAGELVTVGLAPYNTDAYALDADRRMVPLGVVGEIYIGGIGITPGYLNRPDLTAERYLADPFAAKPRATMFKVGDLGRLRPDGNFEILGRMDDQVKLKGYRIELDEVAAAMMRHPRVSAAAAVVKDKTHLVGFVVPADVDHDELRDVVAAALPAYMVPAVFVGLAVMPTNTNGKTDKKALAAMHVEIAVDALQTDTERALAAVWSQVLGVHVADIGRATSFFALGGDSISAIKAAAAMQRAGISITVPQLFKAQTDSSATEWPAAVLSDETLAELAAVGSFEDAYPATPLQAGMVAATMQDARAYVNQVPLRATRTVSLESLRGALRAVVQHHAILRTSFVSTVAGGIVQVVRASADAAECVAVTAPLAQHLAADKARGFSLADASWIRAALVCDPAGSAQHVVVTIHHALYDGWSLPMIMRDLAAALDGHALEPRPAFRTVVDFIAAQDAAATEAFWTQQLVGLEPAQPLSLGHSARTDDEDAPLAQAAQPPRVTVAVVLKAAWAATLRKFTRSHDVVFGEVLANRDIAVAGADRIVGPLLNTVPCRVVLDDTARAADLVASLQAQHGAVLSHSHAALVDVQRWAGVQGDGKLFNTLFVYENMDMSVEQSAFELAQKQDASANRSTDFDLMLYPGEFDLRFEVLQAPHLSQSQAASILAEFDFGVQQLVSALSDKATIESLWTLSPAQQAMIARFSHGERVPLPFSLVHHGFEARAKQHPDWRAVEHGDAHLSYGDLDACGCALAATLASHGVQHGSRVAVVMQRSIEFVVALVGVLKAGATIVPVDSSFPADRIQFMLDDASVCAIVTTASEAGRVAQLSVGDRAVVVADARALLASGVSFTPAAQHIATGDDDAFIVYTSGSTGKPKGVPVPHGGVINVVNHTAQLIGCSDKSRMAQFMAIGFDACLSKLGHPSQYSKLKTVTVTGENCPSELKDLWSSHVRFVNGGGPSEVSILGHIGTLVSSDKVVLGKVLPNYASYVLDEKYQLFRLRFVPDPFSPEPGARMFRTGDLGRLLPDGNFEILGRMDDQVKLKGYRIELDEVAAAMMRHPRVSAAAAVVKDKTHLVGFVVPADVDHDELRDVVAAALPAYMVPAVFVGLAVMPTNTNGKTDKKALAAMHVEIAVDALQTDTERALAAVWSQVLGVQVADIGRATSFFALGGDSISAIRLVAKAKQQGLTLSSALIFKAPTLAKMALAATVSETRAAVSSAPVTGSVALTPIQHMFFAHDWINISHFNQSFVVTPRDTLDIAALTAAIARLAEHHDMLRARFAQGDDGAWSQTLLPPSPQTDAANVLAVVVESDDDALACIREAQESLSITHGPLLAVRLLHMHDGSQRLFFGIHHLVVDLVSWRVLLDDLETLLRGRPLAPKTLSFQAWAARMAEHAATLDAAPWRDLIGDHTTLLATQPPAASVPVHAFHARAVLDDATTAQLDAANAPFNTNIQELVLAALVLSLADVAGCASSPAQLCIELEGHGREPYAADLDVSSTVGWFTSVFPVAFSASTASDIGAVVRQVKHKIRSVPLKGLSHGMIKHLAPPTADNAFVKAHGGHAVAFNYLGRFQSLEAEDAFFVADSSASGYWSVRHDDRMFHAIELNCAHDGPRLVLSATVEDWIVSEPTMQAWLDCWQVWMQRVVAHCVDPATHGGRTVSDVPLMASQAAVEQAEAELAAVLSLRARDIVDMYPVTPLQAGFLSAMMRDASEYTVQSAFDVTGNMDVQRLRAAWHAVAMAHPIVRTVFVSTPSGLVQAVAKDDRTEWAELDGVWSADADALQVATDAFMAADRARGFSMASASFHRFTVARVADGRLRVFWALHHSVTDGWSMPLLMADLMRTCAGADISAKRAQFRDHVEWLLAQDQAASHLFWRRSLEHAADAGKITSPKPRASELGGKKYGELHAGVELPHLAAVCKAHGVTTSTVLRLAWALVLRHFTRNEHVLFGSVVSGRDGGIQGIDEIVGVLINTIAVPARLPLDASIASVLADVHAFSADAIAHSHVGLVDVQRVAGVTSDSRLFDTIMVFENYPSSDADVPLDFALEPIKSKEFVDQPVSVVFVQQNTTMQVAMTFETLTIQDWFAQSMADKLVDVLSRLCATGGDLGAVTIADVDALTAAQQAMIARFSHGERVPLPFSLVHHGFEARAKQHPDWRAVEHGDAHLSYGDLDACGCALAAALASHGVQRGSRVAVVMQRSIEFVVALVGVLKAGATIVPVDSSFPADRIQFMLDDASVCAIVTTASEAGRIAQLSVGDRAVVVADARVLLASGVSFTPAAQHMATSDDDAFIVYTSGSTGKPKGVPVPHGGVINVVNHTAQLIGCSDKSRMAQFMAIGFDACQWETWSALCHGSTVVLREQDTVNLFKKVNAAIMTPTGLAQLEHPSSYPSLKTVTVTGELCPDELIERWTPYVRFVNGGGPSEVSILAHIGEQKSGEQVVLGAVLPNCSSYILDTNLRIVPIGVVGEVHTGGPSISRGYINLPDLTEQRFVPDPFSPESGARMFRTGDLGRLLPDGNFEILGRMDDQVKLKGYRIELDEVAAAMMRHPRVSAAAAVVKDKTHLVGFVVPADIDHDELRDVVAAALPAYMVPAVFVGLAVMPTNTNGKTDKKALAAMHIEIAVDALQTDTERALAAVWSQVLGVQAADIGRATSFFALGGDSISAIKAAAAMQRAGISITVPQLFKAQTVARVAALADVAAHDGQRTATEWPVAVLSNETLAELAAAGDFVDAYPATPLQAGMVAATMQDARAYINQVPLRATHTVSLESLRGALRAVVQHHAILRTSFVSTVAGGIVQVVGASADAAECVAVAAPLAQHLAADMARGFSLADASWIRAALVCDPAGSAQHVVVTIHHALYDGWSLPMIMRDLVAALDGHTLEPRPAFRTVVDFIAAQDATATEAFWTQQLVGLEPAQPLSLGHSARTDDEDAPLAQACSTPMAELQRAAQRAGVTVAVVLKAAWAATLRKFTRSHDVVFGEVLANRDIAVAGADRIVGPLLNTVPCRVVLDDTARAADLVATMQAQHGAVLSHSHAALVDVQRWAGVQGDGKLFNTLFVYENMDTSVKQSSFEIVSGNSSGNHRSTDFDLLLFPDDLSLHTHAEYGPHLSQSQAASILAEFDFGVQQLVSALSDKATIESLWTLSPAQQAMIARFSHGERVPLPFALVHHGFEARAKQHPDWRAVEHGDAHLSYGDLDTCGCALAAALASHGVQRGSRVAVVMQRSIEFVVALVGVLKAGATIVPVDSSFPADRIQFMLDDASVCAIVTTASEAGCVAQLSVGDRAVVVADARALLASGVSFTPAAQHMATSDDLFMILYTSGSTGRPKGVPAFHAGAINVIVNYCPSIGHLEKHRVAQFMAIGFDACATEVWGALTHGAILVLRDSDAIATIKTVDSLFITPTGLAHLGSPQDFINLKFVAVAGEACPQELANLWCPHCVFHNIYGPTEITLFSTIARIRAGELVTVGLAPYNTDAYVLDADRRMVPLGVVGEIYIGGIGITPGYLNRPDLTAERYLADPFSPEPGARMFRTGDLGRLLPDGNFEILGRMDDQVKLKGYRIELDEVAAAMMRHPRVSAAAAVVKDKMHLVGFVVPADVDHDELRDVVAAALPAYMVPAVFVGLAVMPTNTNGKTDKKALAAMHIEIAVDALQTDTERALAAVWSQVLGVQVADIGRATSFFALGGDSISAIKAAAAMQRAGISITVPQLFKAQTVARVAALADVAAHDGQQTVTEWPAAVLSNETLAELAAAGDFVDAYPATPLQAGMVAATMQDARAYANQVPLRAPRTVSLESLHGALRAVVQHHAILRMSFVSTVAGGIVQVVRASADAAECVAVTATLAQHLAADMARGFSLADASWIRAAFVCDPAGSAQHVVVTIHHALYDGWSLPMIMRDLAAALDGHALEPQPAFRTVVDFIAAQDAAATEAFWTQQLVGLEPAQPLSLGHSARTDDEDAPLAQACSTPMAELQRAAQRAGVTVAVVLKAAWAATLRKFTRSHDVVFGEVLANRDIAVAGADRIVGPLLNTVPCRVVLDDTARAADLVASLQAHHGAVLPHSHAALVDVQRWAGVQGDGKLFNTLFVFENLPDDNTQNGNAEPALIGDIIGSQYSQSLSYSFELVLFPTSTQVVLSAQFDHSHLSQSQAASILAEFDFGVQQLVSALSDKATVESLWTLSPAQQAQIARFSHGERVPLPFVLVHHGFEARAKQHPDWRAVEHGDSHLSYGDLDACGCALVAALASHGVQRGSRVAVVMQRSIEFVVALVGVLKAGATIVPVDSSFPADRIQFMLDDASVCAIVTTASEAGRIAQLSVGDRAVVVADARALLASGVLFTPAAQHMATGDDDFAIIYTSGTTGKPKGVLMSHFGSANTFNAGRVIFGFHEQHRVAQFLAIGFDGCQCEIWTALTNGASLVLRGEDAFETLMGVNATIITPTGLSQLGQPSKYPHMRTVAMVGEACPRELKNLWSRQSVVMNAYGPTEISIMSHAGQLQYESHVTIGKPIQNAACYILDSHQQQVPVGVVGEMCLGGIGVSRGYINLPDLTAQHFVPNPFSPEPGARMFRTGDLGRLLPDGNFEILGRMDDQVKLKGYRIELDEVAAAMMRHPRVSAAAAVVKDKTHLVGFVVPADVDHDELRDVVAAALPAYMVPAVFVGLAVMPTNTNGKTDKKALAAMHVEIAVDALQTDTERALAAVWSQVLGVQVADIGRATSFFALGGDSISAIRLVAKAKQQGLTLSSALIFKAPTLAKMALVAAVSETRAAVSSAPVTGSVALTPLQHTFFARDWINISHFNQSFVVKPRDALDIATLTAAMRGSPSTDMLRARFAQGDDGAWSQTLLPPSPQTDAANVLAVVVESDTNALACIREAQESLSITHGPLLAVRLLHMHDGSQRLFFGIHHLVVDLVSWRVLLDDLETLLRGRPLAPKTLSFQAWAERMAEHAATLDAAPWRDLIGDHTTLLAMQPPATSVPVRAFHARAVLDDATTAQLDAANAPFNTNIQELVLAALVLSLADAAGCASSPAQLCIELEGHGREPYAADLDVSSTVGWFTSVFPVAFSASTASDIGAVVRQVKHKIRSVPLKGLSHGMIKYLAPPTADNAFVKAHGGHAVAFNYLGRFQSLETEDAFFVADSSASGYWSVRHDDRMFHAIELAAPAAVAAPLLSAAIEDWIVSSRRCRRVARLLAGLDAARGCALRSPATHGGRTVSGVPLMASPTGRPAVLSLHARDIVEMYPVTPLQAGFLSAMMRAPSEYTVQIAFDITGNMDVQRLRAAWHAVAMAHPIVRTVFVSTPSGLVQAVAKDDRTEWTELDGVWSADADALQVATDAFMAADRARGFSMASASFHRFTVARVADGRLRVFWALHHSVTDGWSMPLLMADLMRTCAGADISAKRAQFRDHVEWLLAQDQAASHLFWRRSLEHAADAGKLASPKPRADELGGKKYGELHASIELPHLAAVCKAHGVTTSTVLRLAWALVLRHLTHNEHVLFGSVVSGRDGGIQGIDE